VEKTTKLFLIFSLHHLQSVNDEQKLLLLCLTSTNRIMNFSISSREKAKFACEFDERLLMMDGWIAVVAVSIHCPEEEACMNYLSSFLKSVKARELSFERVKVLLSERRICDVATLKLNCTNVIGHETQMKGRESHSLKSRYLHKVLLLTFHKQSSYLQPVLGKSDDDDAAFKSDLQTANKGSQS